MYAWTLSRLAELLEERYASERSEFGVEGGSGLALKANKGPFRPSVGMSLGKPKLLPTALAKLSATADPVGVPVHQGCAVKRDTLASNLPVMVVTS